MAIFRIGSDFETAERAGAGGLHQINHLVRINPGTGDEDDVFHMIDPGKFFSNGDEKSKKNYLSTIFNIPVSQIELEYVDEVDDF